MPIDPKHTFSTAVVLKLKCTSEVPEEMVQHKDC